jgi:hypothetical protein
MFLSVPTRGTRRPSSIVSNTIERKTFGSTGVSAASAGTGGAVGDG